jgi:hypothetical protein
MSVLADAAAGGAWERVGEALKWAGREDASGARRHVVALLARRDYATVSAYLRIDESETADLRSMLVEQWGEPNHD